MGNSQRFGRPSRGVNTPRNRLIALCLSLSVQNIDTNIFKESLYLYTAYYILCIYFVSLISLAIMIMIKSLICIFLGCQTN